MPLIQRRNFLIGLGSLLAAPAIVRVGSIMPVKVVKQFTLDDYVELILKPMINNLKISNYEPGDIVEINALYGKAKIHKITEIYNVPLKNKA